MVQGLEGGPSAQQLSLPEPAARWSRVNQLSQISGLPPPPRGEGRGRGRQSTWPPGDLEASGVTCEERSRPQATGKEHSHRPLSERSPAPREPPRPRHLAPWPGPPLCPGRGRAATCPGHTGPALTMAGSGQPAAPASATQARSAQHCEERLVCSLEAGLAAFPEENTIFIK